MSKSFSIFCLCSLLMLPLRGQNPLIESELSFLVDSFLLGKEIPVQLKVIHPKEIAVIFPNHSANFRPFELVDFQAKPSEFVGEMVVDAAIYTLKSFEIADRQELKLRFGSIEKGDTNWNHFANSGPIFFARRLPEEFEDLEYQTFDEVVELKEPPDYRAFLTIGTAAVLVLGLLSLLLRRPIRRYLVMRSHKLEWQNIKRKLKKLAQVDDQRIFFPAISTLWKTYLDPDETLALRSMTTTELRSEITRIDFLTAEQQRTLIHTATSADQVIYAGQPIEGLSTAQISQNIRLVLQNVFETRKKALLERKN